MSEYHIPVLLKECVDGLDIKPNGIYVDLTFGGGGHSREILSRLDGGRLYSFDVDSDAHENVLDDERFRLIKTNYRFFANFLRYEKVEKVDGVLADLGVSSYQLATEDRGFSFMMNGDLDMRMGSGVAKTASSVLMKYGEEELYSMFRKYGEIENLKRLVTSILEYRSRKKIDKTNDLIEALEGCYRKDKEYKYLAKVYQSLRIEVNEELSGLEEALAQTSSMLRVGGRLVVLTYHSLEDRIVKRFIADAGDDSELRAEDLFGKRKGMFEAINRRVIVPSENEIKENSKARSAKLRIAKRI